MNEHSSANAAAVWRDADEQLLAGVAAVTEAAVNQWVLVAGSAFAVAAVSQARAALKAVATEGLPPEAAAAIEHRLACSEAVQPRLSFGRIRIEAARAAGGEVVTRGSFEPQSIRTGMEAASGHALARRPQALPAIFMSTTGVPLPIGHHHDAAGRGCSALSGNPTGVAHG